MTAFIPEAQTLFIEKQGVDKGRPAPNEAYLAGFCPRPAPITFPKITSSTKFKGMF